MTPRAALSDLCATAPADVAALMRHASDAYDAGQMEAAAGALESAARGGYTSWHERARELSDQIELDAAQRGLAGQVMDGAQGARFGDGAPDARFSDGAPVALVE